MAAEVKKEIAFEIGHVLFIDIVGYSKLLINEQSEQIQTLRKIVRGAEQFRLAEAEGKLVRLPDRRRRRTSFSHECGSASFVRAGDYEGIAKTSGVKREASVETAHGNSQRAC